VIVLGANVVSEPMKANANPAVAAWLDRQAAETLYLTAVNLAELLVGVEAMPAGQRRDRLGAALGELMSKLFGPRILPFDENAARAYATLVARARQRLRAVRGRRRDRRHRDRERLCGRGAGHGAVRRRGGADHRSLAALSAIALSAYTSPRFARGRIGRFGWSS
jgi:predicted nucleic acid-binding protein